MEVYQWITSGLTGCGYLVIAVLCAFTFHFRKKKVFRASSPGLLLLTLLGGCFSMTESLLYSISTEPSFCIAGCWFRHIGFFFIYGTLILKLWRVSVIMQSVKARLFKINDSQLYKKVSLLLLLCVIYLSSWTITISQQTPHTAENSHQCVLRWWDIAIATVELLSLLLCGMFCYHTKTAPSLYNESIAVAFAITNEATWSVVYILMRVMLGIHPDKLLFVVVHFIRCQATTLSTLLLVFLPKLIHILGSQTSMHGVLTDVFGTKRVHRLTVVVNKKGDLQTIHCVPCGPLYLEAGGGYSGVCEDDVRSDAPGTTLCNGNFREDEYTRAEVDTLIDMLQETKEECASWKTQLTSLVNNLASSSGIALPEGLQRQLDNISGNLHHYKDHRKLLVIKNARAFNESIHSLNAKPVHHLVSVSHNEINNTAVTKTGLDECIMDETGSHNDSLHITPTTSRKGLKNWDLRSNFTDSGINVSKSYASPKKCVLQTLQGHIVQDHVIQKSCDPKKPYFTCSKSKLYPDQSYVCNNKYFKSSDDNLYSITTDAQVLSPTKEKNCSSEKNKRTSLKPKSDCELYM